MGKFLTMPKQHNLYGFQIFFLLLFLSVFSCSKNKKISEIRNQKNNLSLSDIANSSQFAEFSLFETSGEMNQSKISKQCQSLVNRTAPAIHELFKYHRPHKISGKNHYLKNISQMNASYCVRGVIKKTIAQLERYLNTTTQNIGVILPLTGPHQDLGQMIQIGILEYKKKQLSKYPKLRFYFKDSGGSKEGSLKALSSLFLDYKIGLLIGGLTETEVQTLVPYAHSLVLPFFVLNRDKNIVENHTYTYQLFPNISNLASGLAYAAKAKNYQKVSILKPADGRSNHFIEHFIQAIKLENIEITEMVEYIAGDYDSMNEAISIIAHTKPDLRREQYEKIFLEQKELAEKEGVAFNPRSVILQPKIESDAILIPDNYKIVRFFIKLLKYHGVEKYPLLGTYEWRSKELIEPWDQFLEGAMFADFIGSYWKIEKSLSPQEVEFSKFFVSPQSALYLDYKLLGFRSAQVTSNLLKITQIKRRQYFAGLKTLQDQWLDGGLMTTFHKDRSSRWPVFVFHVQHKDLAIYLRKN